MICVSENNLGVCVSFVFDVGVLHLFGFLVICVSCPHELWRLNAGGICESKVRYLDAKDRHLGAEDHGVRTFEPLGWD